MARNLKKDDDNTVTLFDPVEKTEVVFSHRAPTSRDRVRHMTRKYERQGDKLINRHHSACMESALEVLTGIREGDFLYGDEPLSSDPASPHYREDWKELVGEMAGDLLYVLGVDLFEPKVDPSVFLDIPLVSEFDARDESRPQEETIVPPLGGASAAKQ